MVVGKRVKIGELSGALELGIAIGRARRKPSPAEAALYRGRPSLMSAFRRGLRRGRRISAVLEQTTLMLHDAENGTTTRLAPRARLRRECPGGSPDGETTRYGASPGSRGPQREGPVVVPGTLTAVADGGDSNA